MSSVNAGGGQSNKRLVTLILAVVGALFVILGIVYAAVKAGSLPAFLGSTHPANGHHTIRMAVAFVIGVVLLVAAYFVNKSSAGSESAAAGARE